MKKKLVGILVLAMLVLVVVMTIQPAVANRRGQGYHEESHHGESYHGDYHCRDRDCPFCKHKECVAFYLRNSKELELNEAQITRLKELERKAKTTKIKNLAEVKILKLDIVALLDERKPNLKEMDAKVDKIGALKTEIKKVCLHAKVGAKEVLSVKQQEKAKEIWRSGKRKGKGKWWRRFFEEE